MIIKITVGLETKFYEIDENQWQMIRTMQNLRCFAENVVIEEVAIAYLC